MAAEQKSALNVVMVRSFRCHGDVFKRARPVIQGAMTFGKAGQEG